MSCKFTICFFFFYLGINTSCTTLLPTMLFRGIEKKLHELYKSDTISIIISTVGCIAAAAIALVVVVVFLLFFFGYATAKPVISLLLLKYSFINITLQTFLPGIRSRDRHCTGLDSCIFSQDWKMLTLHRDDCNHQVTVWHSVQSIHKLC